MKRVWAAVILGTCGWLALGSGVAAPPAWAGDPDQPVDQECRKEIRDDARGARRQAALYIDEMGKFEADLRATNGISVCRGAMRRAENYFARQEEDNVICTIGSSYVDRQVSMLFKNAVLSCRSELRSVLQTMPPEDREPIIQRVRQRESELQANPLPPPVEEQ